MKLKDLRRSRLFDDNGLHGFRHENGTVLASDDRVVLPCMAAIVQAQFADAMLCEKQEAACDRQVLPEHDKLNLAAELIVKDECCHNRVTCQQKRNDARLSASNNGQPAAELFLSIPV